MIAQEAYRFDQNDPIDTFNQIARSLCRSAARTPGWQVSGMKKPGRSTK